MGEGRGGGLLYVCSDFLDLIGTGMFIYLFVCSFAWTFFGMFCSSIASRRVIGFEIGVFFGEQGLLEL